MYKNELLLRTLRAAGIKRLKYNFRIGSDGVVVSPCTKTDKYLDRWNADTSLRIERDQMLREIIEEFRVLRGFDLQHEDGHNVIVVDTLSAHITVREVHNPRGIQYIGWFHQNHPELVPVKPKSVVRTKFKARKRKLTTNFDRYLDAVGGTTFGDAIARGTCNMITGLPEVWDPSRAAIHLFRKASDRVVYLDLECEPGQTELICKHISERPA